MAKTIASGVGMTNDWLASQGVLSLKTLWAELAHLRGTAAALLCVEPTRPDPHAVVVWGGCPATGILPRFSRLLTYDFDTRFHASFHDDLVFGDAIEPIPNVQFFLVWESHDRIKHLTCHCSIWDSNGANPFAGM